MYDEQIPGNTRTKVHASPSFLGKRDAIASVTFTGFFSLRSAEVFDVAHFSTWLKLFLMFIGLANGVLSLLENFSTAGYGVYGYFALPLHSLPRARDAA